MKNKAAIIQLFIANSVSGVAQGISMIAIPWYFASQNDMSRFAMIYILASVVSFLWVPYSGTIIDKYNRKNIFLVVATVCGFFLAGVAAIGLYGGWQSWLLVSAVFIMTFANYNIHYPNLYAFMQEITEQRHYGKVTSYLEITGQLTSVLAGAGAALLLEGTKGGLLNLFGFKINFGFELAPWSIYEIFLLDASTYLAAFFIILSIKYRPLVRKKQEHGNVWEQLKIGFNYLKSNPDILMFGVASYSIFVSVLVTTFYLAAIYVSNHLHETGDVYAASEMYYALGAVLAGAGIRWVFSKLSIPMSIIILTFVTTILFAVLFISNSVFVFYGMSLILGITNAGTRILRVTYLFTYVPNQVYGRASSIFFLTNISFRIFFLSIFAIGFFQAGNNIVYAFLMMSIFLFLTTIVLIKYYPVFLQRARTKGQGAENL